MRLAEVYQRLFDAFGPQHWWQHRSPIEAVVGVFLAQNASWAHVERALDALRQAEVLEPQALVAIRVEELEEILSSAGHLRIKARRLRNVMEWIVEQFDGSLEAMFQTPLAELRTMLLSVSGVGPETADSILLYAGQLPVLVVGVSTHRIFCRHGWIEPEADYHQLQDYCQSQLPDDAALFSEFHALLVRVGKDYCRKSRARCEQCPLQDLLLEGGPRGCCEA